MALAAALSASLDRSPKPRRQAIKSVPVAVAEIALEPQCLALDLSLER